MREFPAPGARPVWIASYPRSGNTFLRILLQNCFRLPSYSLYRVAGDEHVDPSAEALEEAPVLPMDWRDRLRDSPEFAPVMIKTHEAPRDTAPAIFIARDGRATIHSYYYYHKKFAFEQPTLTEIIAGACQFGNWSEHYWAWRPKTRPRTLLLNYDDLVSRPLELVPQLARFLDVSPVEASLPRFEELQQRAPAFFRRGRNSDYREEWTPLHLALFNQLHGPAMQDLGFAVEPCGTSAAEAVAPLAQSASRLHRLYLEQLSNVGTSAISHREEVRELSRQIRALWDWVAREHQPLAASCWVRLGIALGMVRRAAKPDLAKDAPTTTNSKVKSAPENTRSFSPNPRPAAPSAPSPESSVPE